MYEVELKVRADHERVGSRLRELEATRKKSVSQADTYYDAPHRNFAETDEAVRIRRERPTDHPGETDADPQDARDTTKLTYKGPLVEAVSKTREEHEVTVSDADELDAILDALGFEPAAVVDKERVRFGLDGVTVTLDQVDGLGEFVEVETESETDDIESARSDAVAVLERLGLDPDEQIRMSYLGLLLEPDSSP